MVMACFNDDKIMYMVMSRDEVAGNSNSIKTLKRCKSSNIDKIKHSELHTEYVKIKFLNNTVTNSNVHLLLTVFSSQF